jgi:hypothetical protein
MFAVWWRMGCGTLNQLPPPPNTHTHPHTLTPPAGLYSKFGLTCAVGPETGVVPDTIVSRGTGNCPTPEIAFSPPCVPLSRRRGRN